MKDLTALIQSAQQGELAAYDCIARQFQDMAVGYSYSLLHDFHWAEDAAQEAFLQAFLDLPTLQDPLAFPAWLRKILFKQCDRLTRRHRVLTCPLEIGRETSCPISGPAQAAKEAETRAAFRALIAHLPAKEGEVIALFYMGGLLPGRDQRLSVSPRHYGQEAATNGTAAAQGKDDCHGTG